MKRTIRLALSAALALSATSAFATNGDVLIGLGAKARGMGGIGIGMSHGAESALANPAMITTVKRTEISFGGTIFMPDVEYDGGAGYIQSDADMNVIPEVSIATKINENFYLGVGMWGTAGMGTDYREDTTGTTMQMITNLQLMQFGVPLAYKRAGLSVGVTPILQYGALDINYDMDSDPSNGVTGNGIAQDLAFGYTLGVGYEFSEVGIDGLTVGAVYKSAIEMEYDGQLSNATAPFAAFGIFPAPMSDKLEQPAEIGIGGSYKFMQNHTVAFDYKQILWSDAEGYKDFQWEDQDVFIIGYEYAESSWAVRVGYNYAENPIKEMDGGGAMVNPADPTTYGYAAGAALNMFNLLGFPAVVESHYTIGGTYIVNETVSFDAAFAYADETIETYDTSGLAALGMAAPDVSTKHSQTSLTLQANFAF